MNIFHKIFVKYIYIFVFHKIYSYLINITKIIVLFFFFYRLTCPEPYFLSEGLYATPEELENTREVTLHVITIGVFIEDSGKVSSPLNKYYSFLCSHKNKGSILIFMQYMLLFSFDS